MEATNGRSETFTTSEFRVSFPHCYTARPNTMDPSKPPKFELTAVFPPGADLSQLEAAAHAAIRSKWGDSPPKNLRWPLLDAHASDSDLFPAGSTMIRTSRPEKNGPPPVVDHNVQPIVEASLYGGCYALMQTNAFCYPAVPNPKVVPGVAFGLNMVQKTRDGEPFAHRDKPDEVFSAFDPESLGTAAPLPGTPAAAPGAYVPPAAPVAPAAPAAPAPVAPPAYATPAPAPAPPAAVPPGAYPVAPGPQYPPGFAPPPAAYPQPPQ